MFSQARSMCELLIMNKTRNFASFFELANNVFPRIYNSRPSINRSHLTEIFKIIASLPVSSRHLLFLLSASLSSVSAM